MRRVRPRWILVVAAVAASSCGGPARTTTPTEEAAPPPIEWSAWGAPVFERASAEGKMVIADIGIEGCTACRWMYEDTYQNAEVVRRINEHFIAVSIDADIEPDLGERYARWGWPATIVFSPNGKEVLAIRGNKRPTNFIPILDELIGRLSAGTLESDAEPIDTTPEVAPTELALLCSSTVASIDRVADRANGGWGRLRVPSLPPLRHAFFRARCRGDADRREHALRTLDGYSRLIDPVWGGVFVAARSPDWTGVIPEKRTVHEAAAMYGFAEAHHLTGEQRWLERAQAIHRYMADWMTAPDGTFFSTQEDDAPSLPRGMSAAEYFELGDEERRQYGIPPIDHGVYTDQNGLMIQAYARLYESTADDQWLTIARRAADAILERRIHEEGWIAQSEPSDELSSDDRMRLLNLQARPYLKPQGHFGSALLDLYRVTAHVPYFEAARGIGAAMRATLEDAEGGGFYSTTSGDTDHIVPRRKPFFDNIAAARFLLQLHVYAHDDELKDAALRTLRAVATPSRRGPEVASFALVQEELALGPVEISIVTTDRDDARARALFDAGLRVYEPRKALHYESPGRYPDQGEPAAYVCTWEACSSPVTDPAELAAAVDNFGLVQDVSACPPAE